MQDIDEGFKAFWNRLLLDDEETGLAIEHPRSSQGISTGGPSLPTQAPLSPTRNGFARPPVFGPERVVIDEQIKAVHKKIVNEILRTGFVVALVSYDSCVLDCKAKCS
jgi:hypothetical protein